MKTSIKISKNAFKSTRVNFTENEIKALVRFETATTAAVNAWKSVKKDTHVARPESGEEVMLGSYRAPDAIVRSYSKKSIGLTSPTCAKVLSDLRWLALIATP